MTSNDVEAFKLPKLGEALSEPTTPTTIGDLYRLKLLQAKNFRHLAKDRLLLDEVRIQLRANACALESYASALAHCIAWFGDGELKDYVSQERMNEVAALTWQARNPWMEGLSAIELESAKARTISS